MLYELWKLFAAVGVILSLLPMLVSLFYMVRFLCDGVAFSDDWLIAPQVISPVNPFPDGSPYAVNDTIGGIRYHDAFAFLSRLFVTTAMVMAASLYSFAFLSRAECAQTFFPDGKKQGLITAGILYLLAALMICVGVIHRF